MNSYEVTITIKTEVRHNTPAEAIAEVCEAIRQGSADNLTATPVIEEVRARYLSGDDDW
jgi:hypothetical protein